jgi:hypothetical protein
VDVLRGFQAAGRVMAGERQKVAPTDEQRRWAAMVVDEINKYSGRPFPRPCLYAAFIANFVARRDAQVEAIARAACASVCTARAVKAEAGGETTESALCAGEAKACAAEILGEGDPA